VKRHLAALLRALLGRRLLGRTGRFLWNAARLDGTNRFEINGEALVQDAFVRAASPGPLVVLDVGANVGDWSKALAERCARAGRKLTLHAFEPSAATFETLQRNAAGWGGEAKVGLHRLALSNRAGTAAFHSVGENKGRNSLYEIPGESRSEGPVELKTLDAFAAEQGLDRIDLVKVDTEGHDLFVIQGAARLLEEGRVRALQFEYTWRWIFSRTYLRDVFELLAGKPYALGKITPQGIEYYPGWDWSLESYVEGNYLITLNGGAPALPTVAPVEW
jgi:FkbM family methyltransferase